MTTINPQTGQPASSIQTNKSGTVSGGDLLAPNTPKLYILLPFILAGGYFAYGYWRKKDLQVTGAIAGILFVAGCLPWFIGYSNNNATPALTGSRTPGANDGTVQGKSATLASKAKSSFAGLTASNNVDLMNKIGRQEAINYIVGIDEKRDAYTRYSAPGPPSREKRIAAFNTLTNDELKVLYCVYKFTEDANMLIQRYGTTSDDATAKLAAKEVYGINLSGIDSINKTATIAITKAVKAMAA